MKNVLIALLILGPASAFAANCRSVIAIQSDTLLSRNHLQATLEDGLLAQAYNEAESLVINAAFITNSKLCYEMLQGRVATELSVKR